MVEQTYQFFDFFWGTSVMGATSPSNPCANCSSCVAILHSLIACSLHAWSQKGQRAFSSEPSQTFICEALHQDMLVLQHVTLHLHVHVVVHVFVNLLGITVLVQKPAQHWQAPQP
jgi:hypothetical protein